MPASAHLGHDDGHTEGPGQGQQLPAHLRHRLRPPVGLKEQGGEGGSIRAMGFFVGAQGCRLRLWLWPWPWPGPPSQKLTAGLLPPQHQKLQHDTPAAATPPPGPPQPLPGAPNLSHRPWVLAVPGSIPIAPLQMRRPRPGDTACPRDTRGARSRGQGNGSRDHPHTQLSLTPADPRGVPRPTVWRSLSLRL